MIFRAELCFALFLDIYCAVAKHFHTAMCCFYKDQGLQRPDNDARDLKNRANDRFTLKPLTKQRQGCKSLLLFGTLDRSSQLLYEQTASWIN
jgi:hypothetical protein